MEKVASLDRRTSMASLGLSHFWAFPSVPYASRGTFRNFRVIFVGIIDVGNRKDPVGQLLSWSKTKGS